MSDMKMYNILGMFKNLVKSDKPAEVTTPKETVYESVEPRGSITEAVKGLESKYATFKEAKKAKPDFLDVDKDGDKAEPFKKAVKDKKAVEEGAGPYTLDDPKHPKFKANYEKYKKAHPDCTLAEFVAAMRKKEKGLNESQAVVIGGKEVDLNSLEFENINKWDAPDYSDAYCVAASFVDGTPLSEVELDQLESKYSAEVHTAIHNSLHEAAYDEPAAPDADAIAKRKRLQAIKDRQEDEHGYGAERNTPIRKVAGKAYGGSAQKDVAEPDELEEYTQAEYDQAIGDFKAKGGKAQQLPPGSAKNPISTASRHIGGRSEIGGGKKSGKAAQATSSKAVVDVYEKAPPGAKAERMVKHIKKGYAKDGKLSKKEKGIAYATAWKAKKAGVVEATQFGDKIANSKAELKKAKPAMVKESRVMEETDYFYEKVAKALAEKNSYLDTAGSEFNDAVRKEMVAQGIPPNKARNILTMDEDFLSDVATSYGHYCQIDAHSPLPAEIDLGGVKELDEIARLAGLPTKEATCEGCGMVESSCSCQHESTMGAVAGGLAGAALGKSPAAARVGAAIGDQLTSEEELDEREQFQSMPQGYASGTPKAPAVNPNVKSTFDKSKLNPMREEEMEEGNEFSGALAKAKAAGAKEFEVDGKKYTVKEDISVNISASGEDDSVNLIRKLAGMNMINHTLGGTKTDKIVGQSLGEPEQAPEEVSVADLTQDESLEEERDVEYTNTPNEKIAGVDAAIPSGTDLNRAKKQYKREYPGDNPMAVKEEALWKSYEAMISDVKK